MAEIQEKDAEIAAMAKLAVLLKVDIERLQSLCARAAEALAHESWVSEEQCGLPSQFVELIAELRKAAE